MKFFVFSDKTLDYHEIRWFKRKVVFSLLFFVIVIAGGLLLGNHLLGNPLGLHQRSDLETENAILKEELQKLAQQTKELQSSINQLVQRGNDLRVMVALPKLDEETQRAAVGGSLNNPDISFLSRDANTLLSDSRDILSQLEREVELQKQNYAAIVKQYVENKNLFKHLPAIKPCEGPYSLNGFGMRIHPVLGAWRMHEGLDIMNEVGTPVYATGDATIRFAGRTQGGYGAVVELDHGYGYSTLFAHLSAVLVREGQKVKRGELIGRVGRSGLVSGPHLHYEVRLHGRKQNPVDYFFDDMDAARYRRQLASTQ